MHRPHLPQWLCPLTTNRRQLGHVSHGPPRTAYTFARLGKISEEFRANVKKFAEENSIPIVEFKRGQRKDDIALAHRSKFNAEEGVVFIGVAQEKASAFKAAKTTERGYVGFRWDRQSVAVNHYYFYLEDPEFGPAFVKVCSYAPYGIRVCLNGHEWAKRQLAKEGVPFESLDNGFLWCEIGRAHV